MRFKLDPTSPTGVTVAVKETPKVQQSHGYIGETKITGLLAAGSNVTITGDGTKQVPYTIASSGGGVGAGTGDVVGPAGATDNAVARFDTTTGKLLQDSAVTIADTSGDITAGKYNSVAISGASTPTLAVTGTTTVSGANTGDQTLPVGGTPALTLSTTNSAGSSPNFLRRDDTILVFDATSPSTQAYGDSAVVGVATTAARRDHKHAMPASTKDTTANSGILKGNGSVVSGGAVLGDLGTTGADFSMNSHKLTNVTDPASAQDAATKNYVDALAQGLSVKGSVLVATAAALPTNTYLSNVITITATGTLTVDGTVTALNDRILVKDEASQLKNGIYTVTTAGAVGVAAILTRSADMDAAAEFPGGFVFVESGTVNSAAGFVCTNSTAPAVGTTAITFTQFSGAGEITAGTGLGKSGNTLSIDTSVTVDKTTGQTLTNKTLTAPVITAPTGIVKGDVGLGNVDNTSNATERAATATLTNKRRTRRLTTTNAPGATPTTNTDNVDVMNFTGLGAAITSMTTNLSGTPVDGDLLEFRFTDGGTARAITWGASFAATTVALPTTTVISTMLRVGFEWDGSVWRCIAVA